MDLLKTLGFNGSVSTQTEAERKRFIHYIALKLIANGLPHPLTDETPQVALDAEEFVSKYYQRIKRLDPIRCPADARIEAFLAEHFSDTPQSEPLRLPNRTIILDRHGLARELSLPMNGDRYQNDLVASFRVRNGVLHNPASDRRTTSGTFHVTEGGLPIPADKKAVPKRTFAELFRRAINPPDQWLELPFNQGCAEPARTFVSLLIRPLVCPEVIGFCPRKTMEVRFFAPGCLISNLDFVESIFGNGGDPYLPGNDAGLDVEHWTGHTGCVILAPHLIQVTKQEAGLPHWDEATDRQRRDGMCWKSPKELYNEGSAFKLTCRTAAGVVVTIIADNYFGYCKKEVKTQISYAANLMGNVEEEHAGGTIAFASFNLGEEHSVAGRQYNGRSFEDIARDYGGKLFDVMPEGYGIDRQFSNILYIPETARASVQGQTISWPRITGEGDESIPLLPEHTYITPSGYKLRLEKHPTAPSWRLIGTLFEGVFCHKPCTVSGGGKSEISKSVVDYVLYGPIFVADLERDLDLVQKIFERNYADRWRNPEDAERKDYTVQPSRRVLSPTRSLGSVIKLLTPSSDYTDDYNRWLESIPSYVYALVFIIKRFHRGDENADWRSLFTVDIINGMPGHELKYKGRKLVGDYLRVGLLGDNSWRTFKLRQDFAPADKIQTEDDLSASVIVPANQLENLGPLMRPAPAFKFTENCEYRLFQRPDDAVHRGLDKQCESDMSRGDNFIVNFEPLSHEKVVDICEHAVDLSQFTAPMQRLMRDVAAASSGYVVCSATPRMIDGKPSQNPRYLQNRPDLVDGSKKYIAEIGVRLARAVPLDKPVHIPVQAVLFGRRNNPPDYAKGIRPLAVYSPMHYQELPELFMDFISSLTGKSPSTTGAGSEGALTKGPFNCLLPITDLNNALVSYLLTNLGGFSTAAGYVGPNVRVDHDISLLIPEIWCRMSPTERDPQVMIKDGLLERLEDFEHDGRKVFASRLGYRITSRFIRKYVGRVFDHPNKVFDESLLKPETQNRDAYIDGIHYITEAHERVAKQYFDDGSIDQACPPLRALLHIMAYGNYEGRDAQHAEVRKLFTLDAMLASNWYRRRLETKQQQDVSLWLRHVNYLKSFISQPSNTADVARLKLTERLENAQSELTRVQAIDYLNALQGCLGADPLGR